MKDAMELFNELLIMQETQEETKNVNVSDGLSERFGRDVANAILRKVAY